MYREILDVNASQVKQYYGFDGSTFNETSTPHGGLAKTLPETKGHLTRHYWFGSLEFVLMALRTYQQTEDREFAETILIPSARDVLNYYAGYFPRDEQGKLLLDPLNSLEMFVKVKNPSPDIGGLHLLTKELLELPEGLVPGAQREAWKKLQSELPPLPLGEKNGVRVILPAEDLKGDQPHNSENPELYAIFPLQLYGVGKPDLEVGRNTFANRAFKGDGCWTQDRIQAAVLGITDVAKAYLIKAAKNKQPVCRFPGFWTEGHDDCPDLDHGGVTNKALQTAVMQTDGKRILLLPAWPKEWAVHFKLHAPLRTVVTAWAKDGKIEELEVSPKARATDVEMNVGQDVWARANLP